MLKYIIRSPLPQQAAVFWGKVLGEFEGPNRRHPGMWLGGNYSSGQIAIVQAEDEIPGFYLNISEGLIAALKLDMIGGTVDRDADGHAIAITGPDGITIPLTEHIPTPPFNPEPDLPRELHAKLVQHGAELQTAAHRAGLSKPRVMHPGFLTDMYYWRTGYQLVIDGGGDLTELEVMLAGFGVDMNPSVMRSDALPDDLREKVDKLAWWIEDLASEIS